LDSRSPSKRCNIDELSNCTGEIWEIGKRLALFKVGQVAENIYLEAQALNLGTVVIGAFHDSEVHSIIKHQRDQSPIYIMPLDQI